MQKIALITGIAGQDGSHLADYLLSLGYEVHGVIRRASSINTQRIDHIYDQLNLHYGDMTDQNSISSIITKTQPDEIYHLAAMSHVKVSFEVPEFTLNTSVAGTLNIIESVRTAGLVNKTRIYNASSSEMFGASPGPQNENTRFLPQSPYACGKVCAHYLCRNYRESYKMFISSGILFNHEGERRDERFVTRKITKAAVLIKNKQQDKLHLGNIESFRDWGYAKEYVEGMHRILQHDNPDDFVIATGKSVSVKEFLEYSFSYLGMNWQDHVVIDPKYFRPSEVDYLCGDASKIKDELKWEPKTSVQELAKIMIDSDTKLYSK